MADITPQAVSPQSGLTATMNAATTGAGDTVLNTNGRTLLFVFNGSGAPINCTVTPVTTARPGDAQFPPMTVPAFVKSVPAGGYAVVGPFPSSFNNASNKIAVTWSAVTTVSFAAIQY